jgi:TolA-binding protein
MAGQSEFHSVLNGCSRQFLYRCFPPTLTLFIALCLTAVAPPGGAFGDSYELISQSNQQSSDTTWRGDESDVRLLELGQTIKRKLAGAQSHTYRIRLSAHQFMNVIVDQDCIDVTVQVIEPGGKRIFGFNSESDLRGRECVPLVAETAGDYRLIVRPFQKTAAAGGYQIRIDEVRAATENDQVQQEAHKMYEKAIKLRDTGEYDEATKLFERVIETYQRILGPDSPKLAAATHDLA